MGAFLRIVGLGIVAAVAYGIAHDSVTARVCVEYFTIGHAPIGTDDPTRLALAWGFMATWWVGFGLGILLAVACRLGPRPKLSAKDLLRPLGILLGTMAVASLIAGVCGYVAAGQGWLTLVGRLAKKVPADRHHVFLADGAAHLAAYGVAFFGGLMLAAWANLRRKRLQRALSRAGASAQ